MMNARKLMVACAALVLSAGCASTVSPPMVAGEASRGAATRPKEHYIISEQKPIGSQACGPCSVYNALANGKAELRTIAGGIPGKTPAARVKWLIERFGGEPSPSHEGLRDRFTTDIGITADDLPGFVNDCLAGKCTSTVVGTYLDRKPGEPQVDHLRRVYEILRKSIDSGFPPIVDLLSVSTRLAGGQCAWDRLAGHFVVVVEVQPTLVDNQKQFTFWYADSVTGKIESGIASVEESRPFIATREFTVGKNGDLNWHWLEGFPYLVVSAPSLRMETDKAPSYARTIIMLRHATCSAEVLTKGAM